MDDDTDTQESQTHTHFSRRAMLALSGAGLAALAGCSGGGGDDPTSTTDTTGTTTATTTTTEQTTTTTRTTEQKSIEELKGEYSCPSPNRDPDIVVAQDGSGDHETVQAAIDAVPERTAEETVVYIKSGRYKEKLKISRSKLNTTFVGESATETVLTYDDHADKTNDRGMELGTGGSASFAITAPDFTAVNLTIENAAEPVAQAVAARVEADRALFSNCRFLGNQDTLYTLSAERQYYHDCYIEGDVDFIFGAATAYFEDCELFCKPDGGYVTAASTPQDANFGYVFNNCEFTAAEGTADDSYYLGRPWRSYARTVVMNSYLGDHIHPAGWDNWGEPAKEETATYKEYQNEGPGYTPEERVEWAGELSNYMASKHSDLEDVLDDWNPARCL